MFTYKLISTQWVWEYDASPTLFAMFSYHKKLENSREEIIKHLAKYTHKYL